MLDFANASVIKLGGGGPEPVLMWQAGASEIKFVGTFSMKVSEKSGFLITALGPEIIQKESSIQAAVYGAP